MKIRKKIIILRILGPVFSTSQYQNKRALKIIIGIIILKGGLKETIYRRMNRSNSKLVRLLL